MPDECAVRAGGVAVRTLPAAPSSDASAHCAGRDTSSGGRAAPWANLAGRVRHSLIGPGVVGLGERRIGPTTLAECAVRSPGLTSGADQVAPAHFAHRPCSLP